MNALRRQLKRLDDFDSAGGSSGEVEEEEEDWRGKRYGLKWSRRRVKRVRMAGARHDSRDTRQELYELITARGPPRDEEEEKVVCNDPMSPSVIGEVSHRMAHDTRQQVRIIILKHYLYYIN